MQPRSINELSRRLTPVVFAAVMAAAFTHPAAISAPAALQEPSGPLMLRSITPPGEDVPPGRQIVFQFDRPVVPIGRMDREAGEVPITIALRSSVRIRDRDQLPETFSE